MPTIYISDSGDDKNDGLSPQTPIYSLKQAKKLQSGRNDYSWPRAVRIFDRYSTNRAGTLRNRGAP